MILLLFIFFVDVQALDHNTTIVYLALDIIKEIMREYFIDNPDTNRKTSDLFIYSGTNKINIDSYLIKVWSDLKKSSIFRRIIHGNTTGFFSDLNVVKDGKYTIVLKKINVLQITLKFIGKLLKYKPPFIFVIESDVFFYVLFQGEKYGQSLATIYATFILG